MIRTGEITTGSNLDFMEGLVKIIKQLSEKERLVKATFFTKVVSLLDYTEKKKQITSELQNVFGDSLPCVTLVAQETLQGGVSVEYLQYDGPGEVKYDNELSTSSVLIKESDSTMLLTGGIESDNALSISDQSVDVCNMLDQITSKYGFPLNNIVRQWNYIPDITFCNEEFQNYQAFNDARSDIYNKVEWPMGYPAATGIGVKNSPLLVNFIAVKGNAEIIPIKNTLQIDAHVYSELVLEKGLSMPTTPKFERGKLLKLKNQDIIFVSGTAAIVGEENFALKDVTKQTEKTLDHIEVIINKANAYNKNIAQIKSLRIYVKNKTDYALIKASCDKRFPDVFKIYLESDVCRNELLVEIEALVL